jgi:hypothetical protein
MAKVIKFYVPDRLRERKLANPPEQRGKLIMFPPTGITALAPKLNDAKSFLSLLHPVVNADPRKAGRDLPLIV